MATEGVATRQIALLDTTGVAARSIARRRTGVLALIWHRRSAWLPALCAVLILALVWQLYAMSHPLVIPELQQIASEIADRPAFYLRNTLITLQEVAVGAFGGMTVAFVLAIGMSQFRVVERAVMPLAVILNATPVIALAPGLVIAFGFGMTPKYIVTAILVFFPFLINSFIGLRDTDQQILNVLRTLSATRAEILWLVRLPASLPFVFAALRICMPLAVIGAVVAEFTAPGRAQGLGTLIVTAAALSDLPTVYASVVILAILGLLLTALTLALQQWYLTSHGLGERT